MSTTMTVLTLSRAAPKHLVRGLASYAYHLPPSATLIPKAPPAEATTTSPIGLTPRQRQIIERTIRVDQAGELGANYIYKGQKFVLELKGDKKSAQQVEEMWETERHHLKVCGELQKQHNVRSTLLWPVWEGMAFGLGAVTAAMGKEAAMACTEAVETVIGEHYDDQIKALAPMVDPATNPHPSLPLLSNILTEFRDDELEHLDTAVEEGAQKAPGHALLGAVIGVGCRSAIWVCERV